jgi:TonB family protein
VYKLLQIHSSLPQQTFVLTTKALCEEVYLDVKSAWRCASTLCVLCFLLSAPVRAANDSKDRKQTIYDIGGEVQPPKLIHVVEPAFDPKSEEAYTSGVVRIQIVVTLEGMVRDPKVIAGLNERQDKKAVEAVTQWRFKPALRQGEPVNVRATVEVNFHLL